jgi:hypothetical protein
MKNSRTISLKYDPPALALRRTCADNPWSNRQMVDKKRKIFVSCYSGNQIFLIIFEKASTVM